MKSNLRAVQALLVASACYLAAPGEAAPVITATNDDGLPAGQRKVPGNNIVYSTAISNTGDATATGVQYTVPDPANTTFVSLLTTPIARADSYSAIGNVQISIAAPGVLANDNDPDAVGPALTVSASPTTTTGGGNLSVAANGSFTYNPAPGFTGNDTFTYTLSDGEGNTDTATVTIAVTGTVWFINSAAGAGGDGRLTAPFNTMAAYTGSAPTKDAGDNIFLYTGTYTTGLTLGANQRLIGQGAATTLQAITGLTPPTGSLAFPATGGTRPTIAVTSGTGVILNSGNTVNGLNVTNSAGSGITGNAVGTLTLADFDVTVTGGSALSLTTSGTVAATGTDNDLNSTTGTALNVSNVTILAAGMTFKSISSGNNTAAADPVSGIILSSTGTSGGLTVTGDGGGSNNGSGGTIQRTTGDGVSLTTTQDVRLGYMNLTSNLGDGIGGSGINGLVLNRLSITGNGNDAATDESGINIANLSGTASTGVHPTAITNTTVSNNNEFEIQISNSSGTLTNLQFTGNTLSSNGLPINGNASSPHGNLFSFLGTGTSVMGLTVSGGSFTGNWNPASPPATITATAIQANSGGSSMTANVSGATFTNNNVGVDCSTDPVATTVTFIISGNTFTGQRSTVINHFNNGNAPFNRVINGTISNNIIGSVGVAASGSSVGNGISIGNEGAVSEKLLISGNTIRQISTAPAISVNVGLGGQATGGGQSDLTVTNNACSDIGSRAIVIQDNQVTNIASPPGAGPFPTIFANISGNSFANIAGQAGNGQFMRLRLSYGTFKVTQGTPTAANTATELDNANNSTDPTKFSLSAISGAIAFSQGTPALPTTNPLPLLFAPTETAGFGMDVSDSVASATSGTGKVGDAATGSASLIPNALTQAELDSLVAAALDRWTASGLNDEQLTALRRVKFEVADLPGMYLGEAGAGVIRVDNNAGGKGWFMGAATEDDRQFAKEVSSTRRHADPAGAPAGRIDLLTAILHEMGHALGLEDSYAGQDRDNLMYGFLTTGERRLPAKGQADGAIPHGEACSHFLSTPLAIGDLPPGKTVTITYTVTINATSAISISSQGTVSGGNITSKVTNDPQTGAADDATVTPIQQPPVVSNASGSVNEDGTLVFAAANFTGSYSDPNSDALATVRITSLPANGVLKVGATTVATVPTDVPIASIGTLTYTPTGNYNGSDSFGWNASDGTSFALSTATVNLTVNPVNDKPTFTASNPAAVNEDAGAQSLPGWANTFNAGTANESAQTVLGYTVSNVSNAALFSAGPAVANNGTLTYTPAANANGTSTFQVRVQDSGGTANGGVDLSDAQTFTITVNAVNDVPVITGQIPIAILEETGRPIALADLTVTDPDNSYPAGFTLTVSSGVNFTRSGNTVTPDPNFVGILSVPVKVNDGLADSDTFSLVVTVNPTPDRIANSGKITREPGGGFRVSFIGKPGVTYAVQYSDNLTEWHPLGTATAGADAVFSVVDIPPPNTPKRFYRVALPYENDFATGLGAATLRGTAIWTGGAVRLTDAVGGQVTAVVFDGIDGSSGINGFTARFNLTIGPAGNPDPADGVNFAVGDLGAAGWGETGPVTASNLSIGFDTYNNGTASGNRGIHVWVNGVHVAVNATSPFTNGASVPVEISHDLVNGLTVKFDNATIFNNLATPGFAYPQGGKFGIGARTGGSVESAFVDDVAIFPR